MSIYFHAFWVFLVLTPFSYADESFEFSDEMNRSPAVLEESISVDSPTYLDTSGLDTALDQNLEIE